MEDEAHSIFVSSHITSDLEHIADSIIFINNGEIVLNEECSELQKKYKIVKCTKEEFSKLKEEDYIAYHKLRNEIDVLIDNKTQFEKKYSIKNITNATIEDIMVSDIKYVQQKEVINLRGTVIPIVRLDEVLDCPPREEEPENLVVVIVKKGDKQTGLVIDNLLGQQEIVIKPLGKYINIPKIISGATILGDGGVALIIDSNSLV
jgi:hypothetical protein